MGAKIWCLEMAGVLALLLSSPLESRPAMPEEIIVDHRCTDVSRIPDVWIENVKSLIKVHHAHTSHGGQLTSGMERLKNPALQGEDRANLRADLGRSDES